jgi:hypothetical protein
MGGRRAWPVFISMAQKRYSAVRHPTSVVLRPLKRTAGAGWRIFVTSPIQSSEAHVLKTFRILLSFHNSILPCWPVLKFKSQHVHFYTNRRKKIEIHHVTQHTLNWHEADVLSTISPVLHLDHRPYPSRRSQGNEPKGERHHFLLLGTCTLACVTSSVTKNQSLQKSCVWWTC